MKYYCIGDIFLARECKACNGSGNIEMFSDETMETILLCLCGDCKGKGIILTSDGETLEGFIRRFVKCDSQLT